MKGKSMACSLVVILALALLSGTSAKLGETILENGDKCPTAKVEGENGMSTQKNEVSIREKRESSSAAYYDFLINEGSFKFWAVFQVVTIAILFYSTFAAIYYAKYTYLHEEPNEEDAALFLRSGRTSRRLARVLRAVHEPPA